MTEHTAAPSKDVLARAEAALKLIADKGPSPPRPPAPKWQGWIIGGIAIVLGISILMSLWFIARNLDILTGIINSNKDGNPQFAWTSMGVLGQVSLRILAIYFGAAAMLAGTATAFYSAGDKTAVSADGKQLGFSFALATASPGIAAVLAGAVVICIAVSAPIQATYAGEKMGMEVRAERSSFRDWPSAAEALKSTETKGSKSEK